jgi:hypothetical protein
MARIGTITMSMQEIDRLKVIQTVMSGGMTPRAARRLAPCGASMRFR